jgi:hypothetical protein
MFLEAILVLHMDMEQKILQETRKSTCDAHKRFVEAEQNEERQTRKLFEKLFETIERDSWRQWNLNRP